MQIDSVIVYNQYFATFFFSCSRAITIHQVIAIFLQFHCLSSYRNDCFPLQLIDQITFLLSSCKCVTLIMLCVRPLSLYQYIPIAIPTTKPIVNALAQAFNCKLQDDFSGIKYYCIRSCENECMYSCQVKFNNEIIYYTHLTYYIDYGYFSAWEFVKSFRNMIFLHLVCYM